LTSLDPLFNLQNLEDNTRELDKTRLGTLLMGASLLRKSLTEDIGSRNESFLLDKRR
jgi:hypothetical protein